MAPTVQWGLQTGVHPVPSWHQGKLNGTIAKTGNFVAVLLIEDNPSTTPTGTLAAGINPSLKGEVTDKIERSAVGDFHKIAAAIEQDGVGA